MRTKAEWNAQTTLCCVYFDRFSADYYARLSMHRSQIIALVRWGQIHVYPSFDKCFERRYNCNANRVPSFVWVNGRNISERGLFFIPYIMLPTNGSFITHESIVRISTIGNLSKLTLLSFSLSYLWQCTTVREVGRYSVIITLSHELIIASFTLTRLITTPLTFLRNSHLRSDIAS